MFKRIKTHCRYSLPVIASAVSVRESDVSEPPGTVEAQLETACWICVADVLSLLTLVQLANIEK